MESSATVLLQSEIRLQPDGYIVTHYYCPSPRIDKDREGYVTARLSGDSAVMIRSYLAYFEAQERNGKVAVWVRQRGGVR